MRYLKIKDNVDLKTLEKYGFQLNDDEKYELSLWKDNIQTLIFIEDDRKISVQSNSFVVRHIGILYDIIQAGIVEVVDE